VFAIAERENKFTEQLQAIGSESGEFKNVEDNEEALESTLEETLSEAATKDYGQIQVVFKKNDSEVVRQVETSLDK
jgi:uncharacterized protein YjaZ